MGSESMLSFYIPITIGAWKAKMAVHHQIYKSIMYR